MDVRPHLLHNLSLPSRFLHQYQLLLLGDRGTRVWTTCLRLLCSSAQAGVKLATSRSLVQRSTRSTIASQWTGASLVKECQMAAITGTAHTNKPEKSLDTKKYVFVHCWSRPLLDHRTSEHVNKWQRNHGLGPFWNVIDQRNQEMEPFWNVIDQRNQKMGPFWNVIDQSKWFAWSGQCKTEV